MPAPPCLALALAVPHAAPPMDHDRLDIHDDNAPFPETPVAAPPPEASGGAYDPSAVEAKWYVFWEAGGFFHADPDAVLQASKTPFVIPMPPPNVTGRLHMGHALQDTVQDLLIRMQADAGLRGALDPGHGPRRHRHAERGRARAEEAGRTTARRSGARRSWSTSGTGRRSTATSSSSRSAASATRATGATSGSRWTTASAAPSRRCSCTLHEQGLVYRGDYLVNWDPDNQTVISNEEVDNVERPGPLWTVRYPVVDEAATRDRRAHRHRDDAARDDPGRHRRGRPPRRRAVPAPRRPARAGARRRPRSCPSSPTRPSRWTSARARSR